MEALNEDIDTIVRQIRDDPIKSGHLQMKLYKKVKKGGKKGGQKGGKKGSMDDLDLGDSDSSEYAPVMVEGEEGSVMDLLQL